MHFDFSSFRFEPTRNRNHSLLLQKEALYQLGRLLYNIHILFPRYELHKMVGKEEIRKTSISTNGKIILLTRRVPANDDVVIQMLVNKNSQNTTYVTLSSTQTTLL